MELHRYDIVEAELNYGSGSIQKNRRPYIIVSNERGTTNATIVTVMPLTSKKNKKHLPVHTLLEANSENGLTRYSIILGEQPQTICKNDIIQKLGAVVDKKQRNKVNKVCWNTFFYGEEIDWNEVLA